jgi:hypothetical protein|tara:strand:- start:364 stop:480 length:117 start_codon:yes stop_codon:yes gene_type:complete
VDRRQWGIDDELHVDDDKILFEWSEELAGLAVGGASAK